MNVYTGPVITFFLTTHDVSRVLPGCYRGVPLVVPWRNLGVPRGTPRFDLGVPLVALSVVLGDTRATPVEPKCYMPPGHTVSTPRGHPEQARVTPESPG